MQARLDPVQFPDLMKRSSSAYGCRHTRSGGKFCCGEPIVAFWIIRPRKGKYRRAAVLGFCEYHDNKLKEQRDADKT